MRKKISVLLTLPFNVCYTYLYDSDLYDSEKPLAYGTIVAVNFRNREVIGVVWNEEPDLKLDEKKIKHITDVFNHIPPLSQEICKLVDWSADYTMAFRGIILKMVLSVKDAYLPPKPIRYYTMNRDSDSVLKNIKLSSARRMIIKSLKDHGELNEEDLAMHSRASTTVIRNFLKTGALTSTDKIPNYNHNAQDQDPFSAMAGVPTIVFSEEQKQAVKEIIPKITKNVFECCLLEGVPGSGKTEIYFEAIEKAFSMQKQVLVMLPEIALTSQWFLRFKERFACDPHVWHSNISTGKKKKIWNDILNNQAPIIVGARSALFLPFANLGLIIVDEEHDNSFKQEENPLYNARDIAIVRAKFEDIPIVLASATPSLESIVNAESGKYSHIQMQARAGGKAIMPDVKLLDLKAYKPAKGRFISPALEHEIKETISRKEQVMLFLNRRGYAPLTLCRTCGHRLQCPHCTAWLVDHKTSKRLECHHCGYSILKPKSCPSCDDQDSFVACGPGVERLAEEVKEYLGEYNMQIASSDNINNHNQAEELVRNMENGKTDILIATQMMAKGYHFPNLTLVGVIDADVGLMGEDPRAGEKSWQLLYQVSGRAGRSDKKGLVILQTYDPNHAVMQTLANGKRQRFLEIEKQSRHMAGMPPYSRLVAIYISGKNEDLVVKVVNYLMKVAPNTKDFIKNDKQRIALWGPSKPALSMVRNNHRRRVLVQATKSLKIQVYMKEWLKRIEIPRSISITIDIDPITF